MSITFEEGQRLHVALWGWLAETGSQFKQDWPRWTTNGGNISRVSIGDCFCCEYDMAVGNGGQVAVCSMCPIAWGDPDETEYAVGMEECPCQMVSDSPFRVWENATDIEERKRLAAIIRDLPWIKKEA